MKYLILLMMISPLAHATRTLHLNSKNTIVIDGPIESNTSFTPLEYEMRLKASKLPKNKPLYLAIRTSGGSLILTKYLIDVAKSLGRPVHTVNIESAGAGFYITQSLNKRYVTKNSLLIHIKPTHKIEGDIGELQEKYSFILNMLNNANKAIAKRLGISEQLLSSFAEYQWYMDGPEAIKHKAADEIVKIKFTCNKKVKQQYGVFCEKPQLFE